MTRKPWQYTTRDGWIDLDMILNGTNLVTAYLTIKPEYSFLKMPQNQSVLFFCVFKIRVALSELGSLKYNTKI